MDGPWADEMIMLDPTVLIPRGLSLDVVSRPGLTGKPKAFIRRPLY